MITIPNGFTGVSIEICVDGRVTGRWFIGGNHPIARRLLRDLRVERDPSKKPRLRMAKAPMASISTRRISVRSCAKPKLTIERAAGLVMVFLESSNDAGAPIAIAAAEGFDTALGEAADFLTDALAAAIAARQDEKG